MSNLDIDLTFDIEDIVIEPEDAGFQSQRTVNQ